MVRVYIEGRGVGGQRLIGTSRSLERQRQVHSGVRVAGQQLAAPFEFPGGLVELALLQVEDAEVVVGGAVIEVRAQRLAEESLGPRGVPVDDGRGLLG